MAELLGPSEAARLLGISRDRLLQLVAKGLINCQRTPLGRLFDREEVERLAERRTESLTAEQPAS